MVLLHCKDRGLEPLKTVSIVVAFPLMFVIGISVASLLKWLKEDQAAAG